jgi:hypothetical protein
MTTTEGTAGPWLRWLLAVLAAAAGVIHLAFAGEHFDVTWGHGAFFAVVGWAQLALAATLVLRPSRGVLAAGAGLSLAVVAAWLVSRVAGVPFGPGAGEPEPVGLADALATGFEVALAVLALVVLWRPAVAARPVPTGLARPALLAGGLAVAVASTLSLTPAFAGDHAHGEAAGDGHDDGHGAHDMAGMSDAEHAAMDAEGGGHAGAGAPIAADGTSPCEQAGVDNEGNSGGHGHRGPTAYEVLEPATRQDFAADVAAANAVVAAYPTVADAEAAGYYKVSPYVPCIAAHYIRSDLLMGDGFDPANPEVILYDGTDPDSQVVGLSYLVRGDEGEEGAPEGFPGPNDPWHAHAQICIGEGGVLGIETATEEGCAARGGRMQDVGNIWMTHMWNVPGWESRWGLFSSEHPDLGGRIGDVTAEPRPPEDDSFFDEEPVADESATG